MPKRLTIVALIAATIALGPACRRAPERTTEVVAVTSAQIPLDPADSAWSGAPEHVAALLLQDLVEPRLETSSTTQVLVRALTNGSEIGFRLEWLDSRQDDLPGPGQFPDGCAIQVPQALEASAPDPQMGQTGRPVEITYWRADWQASINGRPDTLQALYPNATIDHYPFEAQSLEPGSDTQRAMADAYAPAQAVGNRRAGTRTSPVEDLIAEGPGTLAPAPASGSRGQGVRTNEGWTVVMSRRMPDGLTPTSRTQIAFAVWEGSSGEVGSRKMRTGWIPLSIREAP